MTLIQQFPDISKDLRPKLKEKRCLNPVKQFPDISGELRSKEQMRKKFEKEAALKSPLQRFFSTMARSFY